MRLPRPAGLPARIPRWAWSALKVPGNVVRPKPAWFWVWRRWRLGLSDVTVAMFDSITPTNIPPDARYALGYVGGHWPTYMDGSLRAHLPRAVLMSCAVSANLNAKCLDIERGDASPGDAPAWVKRQHVRGETHPVLYVGAASYQALVDLMANAGYKFGGDYYVITAHYPHFDYEPRIDRHICGPKTCGYGKQSAHGTQWTNKSPGVGGTYVDESIVMRKMFA